MSNPSTWILQFPVSLAQEGPDCYQRMADAGLGTAMMCSTIYAPYRLVLPRYPQRGVYSLEEGRYYYHPDPARYRDLPVCPQASADFPQDILAQASHGAHAAGLRSAVWVSLFANGAIAKSHPAWAVENLYGSRDRLFLDFNHPQVIEYSLRVLEEIAARYDVDEIMLDKIPQTCLELNAFHGRIDPVLRTVGSFCFSKEAAAAASKQGLDLEHCRARALQLAAQSLAVPPHVVGALADELQGDTEIPLLLLDHPWILEVLRFRIASIVSFLAQARQRIDAVRKGVKLTLCFVPPVKVGHDSSSPRSWLAAQSYASYRTAAIDGIHCVVHWGEEVIEYDTRRAVAAVAGAFPIITHIKNYGSARPDQVASQTAAARRSGAAGVAYFCYDLMTEAMFAAVGKCCAATV